MHSKILSPTSLSTLSLKTLGWLLTLCFIGMTFIPRSFDNTLFVDGLCYAAISRNMSIGEGSFWEPYFAQSFWLSFNDRCSFFCEHPPLMFGIQSVLFKIFGDTTFVENFYNTIILAVIVLLITAVWRTLFANNDNLKDLSWLPVLFWYGLRIVWWSVPNNLLDTTMTVFCLSSCYFQMQAFSRAKFRIGNWAASGVMIVFACLTKGPVGLFPLALPAIYVLIYGANNLRVGLTGFAIAMLTFLILFSLIFLYPPANYFLTNYFHGQVLLALLKKREKIGNGWSAHFYLLRLLIANIIPHLLMLASIYLICFYHRIRTKISVETKKVCFLTLLILLSVVLPMLASIKQSDYYLMPALPFVGLFFAACCAEMLRFILFKYKTIPKILFPALSISFVFIMAYKLVYPTPDAMFEISKNISKYVPENSKIYLPKKIAMSSEIHTPFQRYSKLSIAFDPRETKYLFFFDVKHTMLDSIEKAGSYRIVSLGNNAVLAIQK